MRGGARAPVAVSSAAPSRRTRRPSRAARRRSGTSVSAQRALEVQRREFFFVSIYSVCAWRVLWFKMDRTELDALVSVLLVNHPVPSLPAVCTRGEGSSYAEAVASTHDILANSIRFSVLHAANYSAATLEASRDAKESLLLELQADIAAEVGPVSHSMSDAQLDACYALFCAAARAYQGQYPGSPDLRIRGMDSVCRSDLVHAQTLSHLRARDSMFEPGGDAEPLAYGALSSYRELIRAAVQQLATVSAAA